MAMESKDYLLPASLFRRALANFIDACLLIGLVELCLYFGFKGELRLTELLFNLANKIKEYLIYELQLPWVETTPLMLWVIVSGIFLIVIVGFAYLTISEASRNGGGLGKVLCGIRVVSDESKQITFTQSLIRNSFKIFTIITVGLGFFVAWFNVDRQAVHDYISNTYVIKSEHTSGFQDLMSVIFAIILFGFVALLLVRNDAISIYDSAKKLEKEIDYKGGITSYTKDLLKQNKKSVSKSGYPLDFQDLIFEGLGFIQINQEKIMLKDGFLKFKNLLRTGQAGTEIDALNRALQIEVLLFDYQLSSLAKENLEKAINWQDALGRTISTYPLVVLKLYFGLTQKKCFPELITISTVQIRRRNPQFVLKGNTEYINYNFNANELKFRSRFASACDRLEQGKNMKVSFRILVELATEPELQPLILGEISSKIL